MIKIFLCLPLPLPLPLPLRRNLFPQTLYHFPSYFSTLAECNVIKISCNCNTPSRNLFMDFVTTRLNISSPDAAKMMKTRPTLGRLKTLDNVEQVVATLKRYGCTKYQIANMIRSRPSILLINAERTLQPKIQLLRNFGLWDENLIRISIWLRWIVMFKLEILGSNLELLKTVFPTNDLLIRAIRRNFRILGMSLQNLFQTSVAFWEDFGFRGKELTDFLLINPWVLTRGPLTPEHCDLIRKFGIRKERKADKYIVSFVATVHFEVLQARIANLQLCGLSIDEALQLVRLYPSFIVKREENIQKKMDFMLNHVRLSVDFVAKHGRMLSMSLNKVMRPRFLVLQTMTAMDGAEEVSPTRLFTVFMMTEARFVAQIIQGHPESVALWTVYKNAIANVSEVQR